VVFAGTLAPWSIVKHRYLSENYTLIKEHFLGGYSSPKGLAATAALFFSKTPLQSQVSNRLSQLETTFRIKELANLGEDISEGDMRGLWISWDKYEFNFLIFTLYPGLLFIMLAWAFKQWGSKNAWKSESFDTKNGKPMFVLSILTMLCVILAHYGHHPPDIVYHQPLAVLILANVVLITVILRSAVPVRIAYYGYMVLVIYRISLYL
jgi:hypothetical protein